MINVMEPVVCMIQMAFTMGNGRIMLNQELGFLMMWTGAVISANTKITGDAAGELCIT